MLKALSSTLTAIVVEHFLLPDSDSRVRYARPLVDTALGHGATMGAMASARWWWAKSADGTMAVEVRGHRDAYTAFLRALEALIAKNAEP